MKEEIQTKDPKNLKHKLVNVPGGLPLIKLMCKNTES